MSEETNRDSMIFYRSFYEAINELSDKHQLEVYKAIFSLSLNFEELELKGLSKTIFTLIKPQLEANNKRFLNGKQPKVKNNDRKEEAKPKQSLSENEANNNGNVNDNGNNNLNDNVNAFSDFDNSKNLEFAEILKNSPDWIGTTASQKNINPAEIPKLLDEFTKHLSTDFKIHPNKSEFAKHFKNWVSTQKEKNSAKKDSSDFHKN